MTKYIITEYGENGVCIQAEGYESAEMIGKYMLSDRLKEISELNRKENNIATFEWR